MSHPARAEGGGEAARARRRYDSPVRRERAAETRARIVAAGAAVIHRMPTWDWRGLTFRAVAECAGVSERTVYRHFATERELHDAVMRRLEDEAGVHYEELRMEDLVAVAARGFASLSSFAVDPGHAGDPAAPTYPADQRRRDALLGVVLPSTEDWSPAQREMAAAVLDVLWTGQSYERMTVGWKLDSAQATQAVAWAISLLLEAIRAGRGPDLPPGRE